MADRRTLLTSIAAALATGAIASTATAQKSAPTATPAGEKIAILGTGKLGQALARSWVRAGHRIVFGSRTPDEPRVRKLVEDIGAAAVSVGTLAQAAAQAEIVVFALPWMAVSGLLPSIGDLSGKIVVDPMNAPLQLVDRYPVPREAPTSVAEELQALIPAAKVVKAFNTVTEKSILDPGRAGGRISIPLAGADLSAKPRVAALVSGIGLEPVDTGPLIAARYIEAMLLLAVGCVIYSRKLYEFHMAPVS